MPGEMRKTQAWPAVAALLLLCGLLPARVAADSSGAPRAKAAQLQQENANLAAQSRSALLDLYALDARLARERARIVALRIQTAQVRAEKAVAEQRLAIARSSLDASERALAIRLQQLYEEGDSDPVAVILGATSVSQAVDRLDTLNRVADVDKMVVQETRSARRRYRSETATLASRQRTLDALSQEATQTAQGLEQARVQRASYIAGLGAQQRANATTIANLEQEARAIEARARQLAAIAATRGGISGGQPPGPGTTIAVTATGYSLHGHTATGAPVGWGVVAVDPSVIPLGTRMSIPGYGEGVAADTGGAIVGNRIDLWFPTLAQARAWGVRPVTIKLH